MNGLFYNFRYMDVKLVIDLLTRTLEPSLRNEAERELAQVRLIPGFGPVLLQVILWEQVELACRQAAVIFLKNLVTGCWVDREAGRKPDPLPVFIVHEADKAIIR